MTISPTPLLAHVLPANGTTYERSLAEQLDQILALDADEIRHLWDPLTCRIDLLPYLAWALSVDLWDSNWDEAKKRAIVAAALTDHKIKGTEALIRRYVGYVGASVIQVVTPPKGLFVDGGTPEQIAAYLALMPQLRVYLGSNVGTKDNGLYLDDVQDNGFFDDGFLVPDRGSALYGRMSVLEDDGVETPTQTFQVVNSFVSKQAVDYEQIVIPGDAGLGLFLDDGFFDDGFLDGSVAIQYINYILDRTYNQESTAFPITYLRPNMPPVYPRWDPDTKNGNAGEGVMLDDDFLDDERFYTLDNALYLIFDKLVLYDPAIQPPDGLSDGFFDDARLDMHPFSAEILINADRNASVAEMFLDIDFVDDDYLVSDNLTLPNLAMDAVAAAKALRDTVLVAFDTTRPLTFGDVIQLDGSSKFDQRVLRHL